MMLEKQKKYPPFSIWRIPIFRHRCLNSLIILSWLYLPKAIDKISAPLSPVEQQRLYHYVQENPTPRKIGLLLGLELGLRIGEICGLQWGDFDLKLGTLKINRTVCRISCGDGHTKVVIQTPKTRTSRREIPIPKQILLMLKKLHGNASNSTSSQHPLLFNSPKPPLPRTYHIRKACTFLVQRKRRSVLGQSGSGDTGQ